MLDPIRARLVAGRDRGPFLSTTLRSILAGKCSRCGRQVPDFAIFGNALVVGDGFIEMCCANCRHGINPSYSCYRGAIPRAAVLVELHKRTVIDVPAVAWMDALLVLRTGYAYLQHPHEFSRLWLPEGWHLGSEVRRCTLAKRARHMYGHLLDAGHCAECGACFPDTADVEQYRDGRKTFTDGRKWSDETCWNCGLPHRLQWHMRETYDEECGRLFLRQTLNKKPAKQPPEATGVPPPPQR